MNFGMLIKKIKLRYFPSLLKPLDYTEILRGNGFDVGENTIFYSPKTQVFDTQRPWMLHIGDYCKITRGVVILTHDYSRSVLRYKYKKLYGEGKKTSIGDNVFIGVNSIILMGTHIGNNSIVGAGSVVSGQFPDDVIIAGNPAKIICTLDEYEEKLSKNQIQYVKEYIECFCRKYNRKPKENEMGPFFYLYAERNLEYLIENNISFMCNGDNKIDFWNSFLDSTKEFNSFDEMLDIICTDIKEG